MDELEIRRLGPDDASLVARAGHLFDEPPIAAATATFLAAPGQHLILASLCG